MDTIDRSNDRRLSDDSSIDTPIKTPKKVSFSDDLPGTEDEPSAPLFDLSLVEHALLQRTAYLHMLHKKNSKTDLKELTTNVDEMSKEITPTVEPILPARSLKNQTDQQRKRILEHKNSAPEFTALTKNALNDEPPRTIRDNEETITTVQPIVSDANNDVDAHCSVMELEVRKEKKRWMLISECSVYLGDSRHTREGFHKAFCDDIFLKNLFRLFDLEGNGQLGQDKWIEHLKGRLTEEKQIDFAEQIESVAYVLCGDGQITFEKFCRIWYAKGILDKLYRLIDVESSNQISTNQIMEFISNLTNSRPRTGFDKSSLERLELLFRKTVGNEKEIRREDFNKIVTSKNPFFTERVFQIFDKDNSGSISLQEFIDAMHQFAGQSPEAKIKFLFKVYDIDGDGLIQHRELQHVMRACMEENGMRFSEDQIDDLTMAMFEDADPFNRGTITYEALKNQLEKHGGLLENLSISIDRWLVPLPQKSDRKQSRFTKLPHQFTTPYIKNNYVFLAFLAVYTIINICLFISRSIQYKDYNGFVILARACGQCLNFNCAFILVLMLRQCITFLRTRGFGSIFPLDHHIYLHKLVGIVVSVLSLVHTIMHLFNFTIMVVNDPVANAKNYTAATWLFTSKPRLYGLLPGCANPTGIALVCVLFVIFLCSQPFVRRRGSFEVFYWTHLLYVPFWLLVLFHGPNFWKWFIGPGLIFGVERLLKLIWMRSGHGKTYISSGLLLPSKVTHLVIKRPVHFCFRPGDYVFVNIPAIAKYEWHPFTLSSAPEQEDYMWLHIRGVGEWTNRLYCYFEREHERLHSGEVLPYHQQSSSNDASNKQPTPQTDFLSKNMSRINPGSMLKGQNTTTAFMQEIEDPNAPIKPMRQYPGTSKLAMEPSTSSSGKVERQTSENTAIRKIQASLQRTFSSKGKLGQNISGHDNDAYKNDEADGDEMPNPKRKMTPEKRLNVLLFKKAPLEKSLSMPDMETRVKKRERIMALREYHRSESERSFDETQIKKARNSFGLAYLSPQNKSLAQSFRYMRNKPTIIAFKTPSLENCEPRDSTNSIVVSPGMYTQRDAEDGKIGPRKNESTSLEVKSQRPVNYPVGKPLEIYIDGPYGAPSSHIFRAQHAVLIATGIGVTPFASILQSIMHRYWKARHSCPKCHYEWASDIPQTIMNLRKVDFFWINRDQRSFEWFVNLLSQLEIEQAELGGAMERFLDMHMYITSALQKSDMKAVGLQLALDLLHEKEKRDLITGLKTRTIAGRPNWDKVFKQIQDQKKGKVTVFYCGPPQLAKTLRIKCDQYGFLFRKEAF